MNTNITRRPRSGREAGFSLLEVLIAGSLLAIALLGHTASIFSEHRLSSEERSRSTAMLAMEQFMERMRSDDDFAGLFVRFNNLQEISRRSPEAADAWLQEMSEGYADADLLYAEDGTVNDTMYSSWSFAQANLLVVDDFESTTSDYVNLRDGRRAFVPAAYYDDFTLPAGIQDFHVAVEVPSAPVDGDAASGTTLREDLPLQRFGLPSDLNGDGKIDDASHADDYSAVPVIVTFHWMSSLGAKEEMSLSTWVWGYR